MESQRAEVVQEASLINEVGAHDEAVSTQGLEDIFQWASDMVADGLDIKSKKAREQKVKRQVLKIIHKNAGLQAKSKYIDEINYLQRRVMALQGALSEKLEEVVTLKQIMVGQYCALQRVPDLEEKVQQLESMTWYREEAEEERKQLMNALAKLKKERDYLEETIMVVENENIRLTKLYAESKEQLEKVRSRRWWHVFFPAS